MEGWIVGSLTGLRLRPTIPPTRCFILLTNLVVAPSNPPPVHPAFSIQHSTHHHPPTSAAGPREQCDSSQPLAWGCHLHMTGHGWTWETARSASPILSLYGVPTAGCAPSDRNSDTAERELITAATLPSRSPLRGTTSSATAAHPHTAGPASSMCRHHALRTPQLALFVLTSLRTSSAAPKRVLFVGIETVHTCLKRLLNDGGRNLSTTPMAYRLIVVQGTVRNECVLVTRAPTCLGSRDVAALRGPGPCYTRDLSPHLMFIQTP